jgi:hypothetical protein
VSGRSLRASGHIPIRQRSLRLLLRRDEFGEGLLQLVAGVLSGDVAIMTIAAIPDILAVLLLIAAGYAPSHGGAREGAGRPRNQVDLKSKPKAKAKRTIRKPAKLKVINAS